MNKLAKIIKELPYEEILKLKKDLHAGNIERLMNKRLDDISPTEQGTCPVCSAQVQKNDNLTLIFGPANFRQKASFDGPDCLIYFLDQIRKKTEDNPKNDLKNEIFESER